MKYIVCLWTAIFYDLITNSDCRQVLKSYPIGSALIWRTIAACQAAADEQLQVTARPTQVDVYVYSLLDSYDGAPWRIV